MNMLQAKDFRIGNYVISETGEMLPIAYIHNDVIGLHNGYGGVQKHQKKPIFSYDIDKIKPVYLSKEVLSKYAELVNSVSGTFRIDLPTRSEVLFLSLKEVGNGKPYIVDLFSFGTSKTIRMVHYLHDIQNIVYCLTGFELQPVSTK